MSSFFDEASLVMIPSGYKDQKVYSVKPLDGSGDLTFSRASNATRVGPDGLIQKVRENLLLQSNTFSTTWTAASATVTSGQAGYDGTNNAWLLEKNGVNGRIQQAVVSGGLQTYTVYLKAGTSNWAYLLLTTDLGDQSAYFNLTTGGIGVGTRIDAKSENIGNGWWRCSVTFNATTSTARIYVADGNGILSGTSGNILIQDAQLEAGDIATDYISTTTAAVSVGPVSGLPRLDYLNSSCPRLLLEPQRTNLVLWSENFNNAGWAKAGASVTANAVLGPDGYTSADKLVEDTSNAAHIVTQSNLFSATGAFYTASIFVKAAERTYVAFSTRGNFTSNDNTLIFNLTTGEWELDDSGQNFALNAEAFPNGWYRISLNTNTTSGAYDGFGVGTAIGSSSWGDAVYTGDGTSGIYIWGAQLEAGAYETSLIPTLSTSVTRVAESASKTGISSLIGQTEGTLFVEFESGADDATNHILSLSDGTTNNRVSLVKNTSDDLRAFVASGGASQASILWPNYAPNTNIKTAISYKANEIKFYANGENAGTDTSALVPASLTQVEFETSGSPFAYPIKQLIVFPTALTATQLAELTTL